MPRDLPLSNGRLLVNFDSNYRLRDIFFPNVGEENHTAGDPCRTGIWVDGQFSWLEEPVWEKSLRYQRHTLVTNVVARNREANLTLHFHDCVDFDRDILLRQVRIINETDTTREVRLFFHYDFHLYGVDIGHTTYYEPEVQAVVAFKGKRYFLLSGLVDNHLGVDSWSTGLVDREDLPGSWKDAEDGVLERTPIVQGHVDATIALHPGRIEPGGQTVLFHWLAVGTTLDEVKALDELVRRRGPRRFIVRTRDYWEAWVNKEEVDFLDLPPRTEDFYKQSLLILRTQIDEAGPIIAATDWDLTKYFRDSYAYMWPRDGAIAALALDMAGFGEITRRFFEFCSRAIAREGHLWQKYTPAGDMASSWHPRIDKQGQPQLPIQEDETGLVLYALWEHYRRYRDIEFIKPLYRPLIRNAADFMSQYREPSTGLPSPSYDLWEERRGIHTFTTAAVWAGLRAAANFAQLFKEIDLARNYRRVADEIEEATLKHCFDAELGCFYRSLYLEPDGHLIPDRTLDSSILGPFLFGMLPAADPKVEATVERLRRRLWCQTWVGGMARYERDRYQAVSQDWEAVPGNPWFICTLWLARYYIARATTEEELARAWDILLWVEEHSLPSGVIAEQVHPYDNSPLSVSPLTWSHAELVITIQQYLAKRSHLVEEEMRPSIFE